ncbi:MAG: RNA polymerase sigma factor, partial [Planctomycetaceae bacterium]|nr:RNA polymerase sigma factor [Planctomycetaceae bacterium]
MAHEDRQLLERSAAGDRAAFGELVERHAAGVFQYARWIVGNDNDAEDVLQQTFLAAWSAAGDARAVDGARPWLVGIARRFATRLNVRRGESRARERSFEELGLEELGCQAGFGDERHTPELVAAALEERDAGRHLGIWMDRVPRLISLPGNQAAEPRAGNEIAEKEERREK